MAQIISRLFGSSTNAAAAVKEVLEYRFGENEVFTVEGGAGGSRDDLIAQIAQAGVAREDAGAYADKVQGGATLVVVHAPYNRATPVSSLFQWKMLLSDPAPLSSFMRWATIMPFSFSRSRGMAELTDDVAPLSKRLNWPLLSQDSAPLSGKMNWRLLTDDPAPFSRRMNWASLSSNPAPLSTLLGLSVLSKSR